MMRTPYSLSFVPILNHFNQLTCRVSTISDGCGIFKLPQINNEPLKAFAPNSQERIALLSAIKELTNLQKDGIHVSIDSGIHSYAPVITSHQYIPHDHQNALCSFEYVQDPSVIRKAIAESLKVRSLWESMPFHERCSIFLKAADLLCSEKYRYKMLAATMLGQGKTAWQAEIDAIGELADFWRFNCSYAEELLSQQPPKHSQNVWNRLEYRSLEGFVLAISPFNFTAIGGNLPSSPALMGNVVIWKPSNNSILSNHIAHQILLEAGLPPGVIQFIPGSSSAYQSALNHKELSGVHFTGSTSTYYAICKTISKRLSKYNTFPRMVGETGGKNLHFIHNSADINNVVNQTVRSAFEYQGQKCSACSRMYVPESIWPEIKEKLIAQVEQIKIGPVSDFKNFISAVINKEAFDKSVRYIELAKKSDSKVKILTGGEYDDKIGYYVYPTILQAENPNVEHMKEEIFGPILTIFVYPDNQYEKYLCIADQSSKYALTASIFAQDRNAIQTASHILRHSAGNFYINDKSTGAVVGQQPFGGSRHSGTNDKAGTMLNLIRWTSVRSIKENLVPISHWSYPSNQ